ncbi:MAG: class I SAM-dependent methyltransferase [Gudongella sp.]|jgi:SAM-dependent methyltransferase|nr:class I SAM-dependent methyltransferase [Gudongella sp.]
MQNYGKFSELYDYLMDDFDYKLWAEYIREIFAKYNMNTKSILEMACGTGNLTSELLELGYFVDAFDKSEEMLALARNKLRKYKRARLFSLDMTHYNMNKKYDAVISACDSINYVLVETELLKVFKNVYEHLEPGGVFIFDINSEYKIKNILGDNVFLEDRGNTFYTWENRFNPETNIVEFLLTFFTSDDGINYTRFDELHKERAYSLEEVTKTLIDAGFQRIEALDAFTFIPANEHSERINFLAFR